MPKLNSDVARNYSVLIRLNAKEKAKIEHYALAKSLTVSAAFRQLLEKLDGE